MASKKGSTANTAHLPRLPREYAEFANNVLVAADTCAAHGKINSEDRNAIAAICAMLDNAMFVSGGFVFGPVQWHPPKQHQEQTQNLCAMSKADFTDWFWKRVVDTRIGSNAISAITDEIRAMKDEIASWNGKRPSMKGVLSTIGKPI